jgi:hypothetical protein
MQAYRENTAKHPITEDGGFSQKGNCQMRKDIFEASHDAVARVLRTNHPHLTVTTIGDAIRVEHMNIILDFTSSDLATWTLTVRVRREFSYVHQSGLHFGMNEVVKIVPLILFAYEQGVAIALDQWGN